MLLTESLIRNIKENIVLCESGVKIPKNAKHATILCHKDTDGFVSGLLMYKQLQRQGIPANNINIEFVQYGDKNLLDKIEGKNKVEHENTAKVAVDFSAFPKGTKLDFTSDHHDNSKDDLIKGKSGKIGATEYGSDTEHVATAYAQNLMNYKDVAAITKIDSANYTQDELENTVFLDKKFKEKGGLERAAIIIDTLLVSLLKKDPSAAIQLMKTCQPSVPSIYNNLLKALKINGERAKAYQAAAKAGGYYAPDTKAMNLDDARQKNLKDLDLHRKMARGINVPKEFEDELDKDGKKVQKVGNFSHLNKNVLLQDGKFPARGSGEKYEYPTRYMGTLLRGANGKGYPFIIKQFDKLIQVSKNPSSKDEATKNVDLIQIMKEVIEEFNWKNPKLKEQVLEKSGGHKAIANISLDPLAGYTKAVKEEREAFTKYIIEALGNKLGALNVPKPDLGINDKFTFGSKNKLYKEPSKEEKKDEPTKVDNTTKVLTDKDKERLLLVREKNKLRFKLKVAKDKYEIEKINKQIDELTKKIKEKMSVFTEEKNIKKIEHLEGLKVKDPSKKLEISKRLNTLINKRNALEKELEDL